MLPKVLQLLPLLLLVAWAAVEDFRTRRIRNWLTLTLVTGGILNSYTMPSAILPAQAWLGLLIGFLLPFVLFVLGAVRGGDVKLLAGIGAWIGPLPIFEVFIVQAIVGLVIVLVQCTWNGRLFELFRNSAVLAVNIANISYFGVRHVAEAGQEFRSIDRPLPYAVPVLIATLLVIFVV